MFLSWPLLSPPLVSITQTVPSFFHYDVVGIQIYFPPERTKKILGRFHGIGANILAALLGTVTPFCSCSSIPIFMGFTSAGLPIGVTFWFYVNSWGRAKIEKLEIVSECESSGTIFMYYRTEFFS